jgi:DNA-binding response OmpR family regulator
MKVLVVEDSAGVDASLAHSLREFGYLVDVVTDGVQAIAYASARDYDIIILDLMLPKESSLLVLHEIRELDRQIEILILSARDQIHDRVTALIQGADDYLVKPFSFDVLHTRIQSLVKRKAADTGACADPAKTPTANAHLNRLIENLLQHCKCEQGAIELVISEVKLSALLERVCSRLRLAAVRNNLLLRQPTVKLPTLLVDVKWMEHLLINLLGNAITQGQQGSEIKIGFEAGVDYGALEIEYQMTQSLSSNELRSMLRDYRRQDPALEQEQPIARFSLARSYAHCMNLKLNAALAAANRFQVRVSNIKIV